MTISASALLIAVLVGAVVWWLAAQFPPTARFAPVIGVLVGVLAYFGSFAIVP